jgi:hypothetical protein
MRRTLPIAALFFLASCAIAPRVEPAATSKSQFEGALYAGDTVTLDQPTPGVEAYRVFRQGATGYVSLQAVRSETEEIARAYCKRKGGAMRGLVETATRPPYTFGNFAGVELIFECVGKAAGLGSTTVLAAARR